MKVVLKAVFIFAGFILLSIASFSLYSHFLLDYSLDNLEFALSATNKTPALQSSLSKNVYQAVVQDLALEEATQEKTDLKSLVFLEIASRSFDEAVNRAGLSSAKVYLNQVSRFKEPARSPILRTLDKIYFQAEKIKRRIDSLRGYIQRRFSPQMSSLREPSEYSSLFLLSQAQDSEAAQDFEKAAENYRKYLGLYPKRAVSGFVSLSLARILMRQMRLDEAKKMLSEVEYEYAGTEEAIIAEKMIRKISILKEREKMIKELEARYEQSKDPAESERIEFKLALAYLSSYQAARAIELLRNLSGSQNEELSQKAKFYLGWAYKLNADYSQGEKFFLELLNEKPVANDLELGLRAELADIYYHQRDVQKSLEYYQSMTTAVEEIKKQSVSIAASNQLALENAWLGLSELQQANIYYFDLDDKIQGETHLIRSATFLPEIQREGLKYVYDSASKLDLRAKAFEALESRQISLAYELFVKNLMYDAEDAWTHAGLASVYILFGDLNLALDYAQKAYDFKIDEYTTSVLGYVHAMLNHWREAEGSYQQARSYNPEYLPASFNLACLYLKQGEYQKGLDLLIEVDQKFNKINKYVRAKILNNMGFALWWLGKKEAAAEEFKKAIALAADFDIAKKNLVQISSGKAPEAANLIRE